MQPGIEADGTEGRRRHVASLADGRRAGAAEREVSGMSIFQTAEYQVEPGAVVAVKQAIEEFVAYVRAHEPGTRLYRAWQRQDDPTRFVHLFIFEDAAGQMAHSGSAAVARFEAAYRPHLVGGDVIFTDFDEVAANHV
jgi:quinol monooxygenase YgiN